MQIIPIKRLKSLQNELAVFKETEALNQSNQV
jgi:hypothetical protein